MQATLREHTKEVRGVAFSPDGRTLATAGWDRTVKLWAVPTRAVRLALKGHKGLIYAVTFSPDGRLLISAGDDGAKLWDTATGQEKFTWKHGNSLARCIAWSADGSFVLTGGWDGTVRVWNAQSGDLRARFDKFAGVDGIAFSRASRLLAVCSMDRNIPLLDLDLRQPGKEVIERVGALLRQLDDEAYETREAAGKELLNIGFVAEADLRHASKEAASAEVRIRARRLRQEILSRPKKTLIGHTDQVASVAFPPAAIVLYLPPMSSSW